MVFLPAGGVMLEGIFERAPDREIHQRAVDGAPLHNEMGNAFPAENCDMEKRHRNLSGMADNAHESASQPTGDKQTECPFCCSSRSAEEHRKLLSRNGAGRARWLAQ